MALSSTAERALIDLSRLQPPPESLPGRGPILVGFSGGPDSVCLAALLAEFGIDRPLRCLHVDHQLDAGSGNRALDAVRIAAGLGLECLVETVSPQADGGPEAAARRARYQAFARHLESGQLLVTAHHADDQAETVLMRLLRGAGPDGLAGIPRQRRFGSGWIARPLLELSRAEIIAWLRDRKIPWVEDPTNRSADFDRNFIRHQVMPGLIERWPGVTRAIRRSGALCQGAALALGEQAEDDLSRLGELNNRVELKGFLGLSAFRRANLIRRWCQRQQLAPPPGPPLEEFVGQSATHAIDRQPELRWDGSVLTIYRRWLWLDQQRSWPSGWRQSWSGRAPLELPAGLGRLENTGSGLHLSSPFEITLGQDGERIRLPGRGHRHAVAKLMNEAGIPPWQRPFWPRLWQDGELQAVGDRWLSVDLAAALDDQAARLRWITTLPTSGLE